MGSVADCFERAGRERLRDVRVRAVRPVAGGRFTSHHRAKLAIFDYLEAFYDPRRRHSALGQIAPATFETNYRNAVAAA